jgi:N-carbamoylputrescine amidase
MPTALLLIEVLVATSVDLDLRQYGSTSSPFSCEEENAAGNITLAMLQLSSTGDHTRDLKMGWEACTSVAAWSDLAIFPAGWLSMPQCATAEQQALSAKLGLAILATCSDQLTLTDSSGTILFSGSRNMPVSTLQTESGSVRIGALSGNEALWSPLAARALMLGGAELIVVPVEVGASDKASELLEDSMLLSRGFENTAAVARVNHAGPRGGGHSALANWCNDWLPEGCPWGSTMIVRAGSGAGAVKASFSLSDLRKQRRNGIWGDAFRHPYAYQQLCGFLPTAPLPPTPLPQQSKPGTLSNLSVSVALLQMAPPTSVAEALAMLDKFATQAAGAGADVAVTPEMWSVGWDAMWPGSDNQSEATVDKIYEWTRLSESVHGDFVAHVRALARRLNVALAVGYMRREEPPLATPASNAETSALLSPPLNSVVVVDRHGEIQYTYDKVHTCSWLAPSTMLASGREFHAGVIETKGGARVVVGSIICADREFPEGARTLASLKGVELLLTPNACDLKPSQLRQFQTRAAENLMAVAMTNYAGDAYRGRSVAYDHTGAVAAGPAGPDDSVLLAQFDIGALRAAREASPQTLAQPPLPSLCEPSRRPEYQRQNIYGRVGGSVL